MDLTVLVTFALLVLIGALCSYVGFAAGKEDGYQIGYMDGIFDRNNLKKERNVH
jgi:hypothetical protein